MIGGSVPFVLFFEGLARAEATQAAFIQKTLVVWVALLAVPLLRERFGLPHALAICLLIAGQAWLAGSAGTVVFGTGEAMILAATLLWAVEVVLVKRLLAALVAAARSPRRGWGSGRSCSLGWVAVSGQAGRSSTALGARAVALGAPDRAAAHAHTSRPGTRRSRARRRSTSRRCSSFGAVVTALLAGRRRRRAGRASAGIVLVAAGAALVAGRALRRPTRRGCRA